MGGDKKSGSVIHAGRFLLIALTFLLVAPVVIGQHRHGNGSAGQAFVQQNSATPQTTENSVTVTYSAAQTAGDTNIVAIGWNSASSSVSSVTDSEGNSYQAAVPLLAGSSLSQIIYYAANIKAAGAGRNVVTVEFSASVPYADIRALEYSGLATASPFDAGASASGNSATANSGSVRTTNANDLIFGAGMTETTFQAAGAGFTNRVITAQDGDIAEDEMVSTTGSYAATAPLMAGEWLMQIAAFKAAGGGASTPTLPTVSSFGGSPSQIVTGSSTTLSWNVANASSITITPGSFTTTALIGSTSISPTSTTVYTLTATSTSGSSTATTSVYVDTTPPTVPASLTASATGTSTISLSWAPSSDSSGPGLAGYNIYRCAGASCTPSTLIGASTIASYGDTGLATSTTYTYAVAAYDTLGLASAKSSHASATTQGATPPTISSFVANPTSIFAGQSSTLSWSVSNSTSLSISNGVGSVTNATSTSVSPTASTTYTLTASNTIGTITAQATVTVSPDSTPPSTPAGLTATAASSSTISLNWASSTDTGGPGLVGYNIYRCAGASCTPSTLIGKSTTASYTDTGLAASISYTYAVAAYDTLGLASAMSSPASATTEVASLSPVPFAAYSSGTDNAYYQDPIAAITSPSLIMYPKTPGGGFVGGQNNCALAGIYSAPGLTQTTPADSASETWTQAATKSASSAGLVESVYYVLGDTAGATNITEALTGSSTENSPAMTSIGGWLVELANCNPSAIGGAGTLDAIADGSNLTLSLSAAPNLGDTVILFAIDATVAVESSSASPTTFESIIPGSGYTARTLSKTFGKFIEYSSSTTSESVQFNPGGSDEWLAVALVIKQSSTAGTIPSGKFIDTWQEEEFPAATTDTLDFPFMGNTIAVLMTTGTQYISSITGSTCTWSTGVKETADQTAAQIAYGTDCTSSATATVTPTFNAAPNNPGTTVTLVSMSNMISSLDSSATTNLTGCSASSGLVSCDGGADSTSAIGFVGITPSAENEISFAVTSISQHTTMGIETDANGHTPQIGFAIDTKADDAYDTCDGSTPGSTLNEDNGFAFYQNTSDTLTQTFTWGSPSTWVTAGALGKCLNEPTGTSSWDAVGVAFK